MKCLSKEVDAAAKREYRVVHLVEDNIWLTLKYKLLFR